MKKPEEQKFSKYFKAIGDPSRLRILYLLSGKELTVNEIAEKIGLSQSTISRHLAILRDAEVAIDRREGQKVFYSLNISPSPIFLLYCLEYFVGITCHEKIDLEGVFCIEWCDP